MDWLLIHYPRPTYFMFLGLIIGVLPYLFKEFDVKRNFLKQHYVILLVSLLLIASLLFVQENTETLITSRSFSIYLLFDRKSTRLNSSHVANSHAAYCLKKKL